MKKMIIAGCVLALVGLAGVGVASAVTAPPVTNHLTVESYLTLDVNPPDLYYNVASAGDTDSQELEVMVQTNSTWWRSIDWTDLDDGAGHTIPKDDGGFSGSSDLYGPLVPGDAVTGLAPTTTYYEMPAFTFDYDGTYAPGTYTGTITVEAANS